MTAAVIDLATRRPAPRPEPRIIPTPGWGPCPLEWCSGCANGHTYVEGDGYLTTDRVHTRTVGDVVGGTEDGGEANISVTLTGYEEFGVGVYSTDIALMVGGRAVLLDPAAADRLRAALGAAVAATRHPAAVRPPSGGGRASTWESA